MGGTQSTQHATMDLAVTAPETSLEKLRAETIDEDPIDPKYPTLFHHLAAMAEHLEHFIAPDLEDYQDWYFSLRLKTEKNMAKLATGELEEKWQQWKADQINHRTATHEAEIDNTVRSRTASYFTSAASSLGLNLVGSRQDVPQSGRRTRTKLDLYLDKMSTCDE
jgi:hypothetical protein